MCIAAVLVDAGHGEQRPLERHEVGNHRDCLGGGLVCVRPSGASWFRLLPIRAIWRMRSLSMARAGAVHVRVRAIASRSSAEGDTPAGGARSWGFEGGRSVPLPGRSVQHCVGWLTHLKGARQPPAPGILGRRNLHTRTRRRSIPAVSTP